MNTVIVTGGSGLLGASVVKLLVEEEQVRPVVMDLNPDPVRLADVSDRIEYVEGNVADPELLNTTFRQFRPTTIYHFASILGDVCENDQMRALKVNVDGFMHMLEAMSSHDVAQLLFSSSATTYGEDLQEGEILTDTTLQRPASFYGITKVFIENTGRYYRKKYDLDFRSIRYPAIIGPGLREAGIVSYTSAMIEVPAGGQPYTIAVSPEIRLTLVYVEDGARAIIDLGRAAKEDIRTINYFINGVREPIPNAGEMAEAVRKRIPGAQIDFDVNPEWDRLLISASHMVDDSSSVREWGWQPKYDTFDKVIDAYLADLKQEERK